MKPWCSSCHQILMRHPALIVGGKPVYICTGRGCHKVYANGKVTTQKILTKIAPPVIPLPAQAVSGEQGTCSVCNASDVPVRLAKCWPCTVKELRESAEVAP